MIYEILMVSLCSAFAAGESFIPQTNVVVLIMPKYTLKSRNDSGKVRHYN